MLSRRALSLLANAWPVHTSQELHLTHVYEDVAVGKTLRDAGVLPRSVLFAGIRSWNSREESSMCTACRNLYWAKDISLLEPFRSVCRTAYQQMNASSIPLTEGGLIGGSMSSSTQLKPAMAARLMAYCEGAFMEQVHRFLDLSELHPAAAATYEPITLGCSKTSSQDIEVPEYPPRPPFLSFRQLFNECSV
jgi:hypothetical protein